LTSGPVLTNSEALADLVEFPLRDLVEWEGQGWGAEVGAYLLESGAVPGLTLSRIAAFDTIVPNCPQAELGVLPDLASVVTTARRLAHDR